MSRYDELNQRAHELGLALHGPLSEHADEHAGEYMLYRIDAATPEFFGRTLEEIDAHLTALEDER